MGRSFRGIAWGIIFIVIGVLMILDRMHMIYFDLGRFLSTWWPLVLIIIGVGLVVDHSPRSGKRKEI